MVDIAKVINLEEFKDKKEARNTHLTREQILDSQKDLLYDDDLYNSIYQKFYELETGD